MANDRDARGDLAVWLDEELRCARLAAGYTSQDQFARELGFDRMVIVTARSMPSRSRRPDWPALATVTMRLTSRLEIQRRSSKRSSC
jgi:hypothetical protein